MLNAELSKHSMNASAVFLISNGLSMCGKAVVSISNLMILARNSSSSPSLKIGTFLFPCGSNALLLHNIAPCSTFFAFLAVSSELYFCLKFFFSCGIIVVLIVTSSSVILKISIFISSSLISISFCIFVSVSFVSAHDLNIIFILFYFILFLSYWFTFNLKQRYLYHANGHIFSWNNYLLMLKLWFILYFIFLTFDHSICFNISWTKIKVVWNVEHYNKQMIR